MQIAFLTGGFSGFLWIVGRTDEEKPSTSGIRTCTHLVCVPGTQRTYRLSYVVAITQQKPNKKRTNLFSRGWEERSPDARCSKRSMSRSPAFSVIGVTPQIIETNAITSSNYRISDTR
jgi:hypothetical protein